MVLARLLLGLGLLICLGVRAQTETATLGDALQPLTLLQAWRAAQANDPTLRAAQAAAAVGRERVPQAQAQLRPSLQVSTNQIQNDSQREALDYFGKLGQTHETYVSNSTTLSLRQALYRPQFMAALRQAGHVVANAEAVLLRETQSLAVRLAGAYFDVLLARDQLALVAAQTRFLETQLDAAGKSFTRGTGTRTDVDETRARVDLNRAQQLEARQQVELTRRQLMAMLNQPFGELARLGPLRFDHADLVATGLDEWLDAAAQASPDLLAQQALLEAAREEIARTQAAHLPTLDLVAQVQDSRSENATSPQTGYRNKSFGVQLNVPLYSGGYASSAQRQALADYERQGALLEASRHVLGVRVYKEFRGATEGVARVKALEVAVQSADVALDSARKSLAAGVRTTVDVLNAEQLRVQSLRDLAQARYNMLMASVRLHALANRVDEAMMAKLGASLSQ